MCRAFMPSRDLYMAGPWVSRFNNEWVNQLGVYRLGGRVTRWPAHASR